MSGSKSVTCIPFNCSATKAVQPVKKSGSFKLKLKRSNTKKRRKSVPTPSNSCTVLTKSISNGVIQQPCRQNSPPIQNDLRTEIAKVSSNSDLSGSLSGSSPGSVADDVEKLSLLHSDKLTNQHSNKLSQHSDKLNQLSDTENTSIEDNLKQLTSLIQGIAVFHKMLQNLNINIPLLVAR